ncbi:MAG: glycosyltransferase [Microbacteriaceae bacterium]|jgi:glycosyltransferase involved in cell wall biosynthesis|nr:glycosyltransferase [Microbacteriaceae bacterium]
MIVLLFSNSYPFDYATEQTFLKGEVEILRKQFERVVLVPRIVKGNRLPAPDGVEVDTSFAECFTLSKRIVESALALFSKDFYLDIKKRLPSSLKPAYLRRLFSFVAGANLTRKWMQNWLNTNKVSASEVIAYTYWFDEISMGLGLAKDTLPLRVVSRAHGYDLYEELYGDWPCRPRAIELMDGLFSVSEVGSAYLFEKYPQFCEKYETFLLGVPEPQGISKPSTDGVLRVVSCSMLYDIKRVDLLLDGVVRAANKRSAQMINWQHFGGRTDECKRFSQRIAVEFPSTVNGFFPGFIPQKELIQNYIKNPVDVFVNVSSTEGTPVSIMEAISCGIPVIATAVGGNVEIVREKNGFLLSENPTPDEIADALLQVCDNRELWLEKRKGSREVWQERYNETTNFEAFAQKLVEIRKR